MAIKTGEFLQKDVQNALLEYKAAKACICRMEEKLTAGDLKEAKLTAVDYLNSLTELERLQSRKENYDRLERTVEELTSRGIDIAMVTRCIS
ncbi:hypothetical protein [Sutcliffiella halmapala]|uniref:hypothetical protein n=1 Tax=Sutcliffiella halmapala TaxID=79882 RepID=UPI000995A70A|nr:hypothetical protein [Sutcliffiella halmapala]